MNLSRYLVMSTAVIAIGSACGNTEKIVYIPQEMPEETVVITEPPSYVYTDEQDFLDGIDILYTGVIYVSDSELLTTGYAVCDGFRSGVTADEAVGMMIESSSGDEDTYELLASITASAVTYLCPDQGYKFSGTT